ncbi:MAG: DHHA1 domain-containing protein, partial [Gemmatimonadales bacterium]
HAGRVSLFITPTVAEDRVHLGELADRFRAEQKTAAILVLVNPASPNALSVAVTDDLAAAGKDANALMRLLTSKFGGRGGGRTTFASGSLAVPGVEPVAVTEFPGIIKDWVGE